MNIKKKKSDPSGPQFPWCHIYKNNTLLLHKTTIRIEYDDSFTPCLVFAAAAKSHQSCPTLCDPMDCSPPGSAVPGILQARTLEWVAISFPNTWRWKVKVKSLSHVRLLATPWTAAYQAPLSMGLSRQEYWLLLLLLSRFSRVRLCATPQTAAHQAPPSLGFSRQENWSGLPFPSPVHESAKWKWSRSVVSDS